jgi:hypothetical protein
MSRPIALAVFSLIASAGCRLTDAGWKLHRANPRRAWGKGAALIDCEPRRGETRVITGEQIRRARALLPWTRFKLSSPAARCTSLSASPWRPPTRRTCSCASEARLRKGD